LRWTPSSRSIARTKFRSAIRAWLASVPLREKGWLSALSDARVGRAMALMHQSPQTPWTVDRLDKAVGMSRSAFSTRFSALA
jgi:AraC-like DNA-binding protein